MITIKVTVPSPTADCEGGGFPQGAFDELLQREVQQPGLDPLWRQILIDAQVIDDGQAAELTLRCEPRQEHLKLHQSLRVFPGTPPAYVRALDEDGQELHAGMHASPFEQGKRVALGEHLYEVISEQWPGRHPETGVCAGDIDWQHVTVRKLDQSSWLPSIAS